MNTRALSYALAVVAGVLLLLILLAAWLVIGDRLPGSTVEATATPAELLAATIVSANPSPTASRELPPPLVEVLPSATPQPTSTPAPTLPPTDTPVPAATATPPPTATATRPPVVVQPLPTNTQPPPPPPTAVPVNTRGLNASFAVEGGPTFGAGQDIWFNFNVSNSAGNPVEFGMLGAFPKKDGVDRLAWFQGSWTNEVIPTGGLQWRDHINLNEPGSYTLRLAICFDSDANGCRGGAGNWVTLSQEVPLVIQ
jgi:hypothetical protein